MSKSHERKTRSEDEGGEGSGGGELIIFHANSPSPSIPHRMNSHAES